MNRPTFEALFLLTHTFRGRDRKRTQWLVGVRCGQDLKMKEVRCSGRVPRDYHIVETKLTHRFTLDTTRPQPSVKRKPRFGERDLVIVVVPTV